MAKFEPVNEESSNNKRKFDSKHYKEKKRTDMEG
jgi:hypothetical protein